jgi:hypothetical protein
VPLSMPYAAPDLPARLLFHRRLFLWTHAVLAFLSICVYVHVLVPSLSMALSRGRIVLYALPALWPYVVSARLSWPLVSEQRFGLYLFLPALVIGGIVSMALALGTFGLVTDFESLLLLYCFQMAGYYGLSWVLDIEAPSNNRWRGP